MDRLTLCSLFGILFNGEFFFINSSENSMASVEGVLPQVNGVVEGVAKETKDLARLCLVTGLTSILIALLGLLGADWDIQWHAVLLGGANPAHGCEQARG
jgi:hypothetical protein